MKAVRSSSVIIFGALLSFACGSDSSADLDPEGQGASPSKAGTSSKADGRAGTGGVGGASNEAKSSGGVSGATTSPAGGSSSAAGAQSAGGAQGGNGGVSSTGPGGAAGESAQAGAAAAGAGGQATAFDLEKERRLCIEHLNNRRATLEPPLPPVLRYIEKETCADRQMKSDSETNHLLSTFLECDESAKVECAGFEPKDSGRRCVEFAWQEGPGGANYQALFQSTITKAACGFFITPEGRAWTTVNVY